MATSGAAPDTLAAEGAAVAAQPWWRDRSRLLGAALILGLLVLGAAVRFHGLGEPPRIYFDETYYVAEARDLLDAGVERTFTVHPPLGTWVIAAGIALVGDAPAGWRAGPAAAGVATVLVTYLAGMRLFARRWAAGLAGLLAAIDGLALTMSRIAMLDATLALFVVTGFWLLLVDRDRQWAGGPGGAAVRGWPSWPRWLAGLAFGLAVATKWSGLLAIGGAGLFLLASEIAWRRRITGRALTAPLRGMLGIGLPLLVVPALVYVLSYAGWFANPAETRLGETLCPEGVCELGVTDLSGAWLDEQTAIWRFHTGLQAEHPYRSTASSWPALQRPVAYYYASCLPGRPADKPCEVAPGTVAEILGIGNPGIWWPALLAYPVVLWLAVRDRDWRAWAILAFLAAQYLPWLAAARPLFLFYLTPAVPFIALALAYSAWRAAATRLGPVVPLAVAALAVAGLVFWWPVLTGVELSEEAWQQRMWLDSWV